MDAASELSNIVETVDATRADLAEFRHETRRELDKIWARLNEIGATMVTKSELLELKVELKSELGTLRSEFKDALLTQTRWLLAGIVTVLLAIYFRT